MNADRIYHDGHSVVSVVVFSVLSRHPQRRVGSHCPGRFTASSLREPEGRQYKGRLTIMSSWLIDGIVHFIEPLFYL